MMTDHGDGGGGGGGMQYDGPSALDYAVAANTKPKKTMQAAPPSKPADDDWADAELGDDLLPM